MEQKAEILWDVHLQMLLQSSMFLENVNLPTFL